MIVVDASVLVDALVYDGLVGAAARSALVADSHWAAPAHLLVEVVSVIRGKVLGGKLGLARAHDVVAALPRLVVDHIDPAQLVGRMWQLRGSVSPYAAAYVAAAEALECPLVTSDGRLAKARGLRCAVRVVSAG